MPDETELPVREFADRGTLWLLELPENLQGLIRLVAKDLADKLDFRRAERVNRSFIPEDLQKQEADLLYQVPFQTGSRLVFVYVLLEHQSKPDPTMGYRLLSYMLSLWQMQVRGFQDAQRKVSEWRLNPILPLVFYTGKRRWKHPLSLQALMDTPQELQRFVPAWETLFVNLHQTPPESLLGLGEAVGLALRALQVAEGPKEALAAALREVTVRLDGLPDSVQASVRKALLYLYLLIWHKREEEEQAALFSILEESLERRAEELREVEMTGAQALINKGRQEGKQEGRLETLLEQLTDKFGELSEPVLARLQALSEAELKQMTRRILTARSLEELGL